MNNVRLFWGYVEEIEKDQVRVRTRTFITRLIDVMSFGSETKAHSTLIKKDDPILVLNVGDFFIGFLGRPGEKLELEEGMFEKITYSDGTSIKIKDKKLEIEGFDEVSSSSKAFKVLTSKVELGSKEGLKTGVVTQECLCAFTGSPHPQASSKVVAEK